jgi:dienelactone hydrolase
MYGGASVGMGMRRLTRATGAAGLDSCRKGCAVSSEKGMRMKIVLFFCALSAIPLAVALSQVPARAAVRTETVEYKDGDTILQGFLAYDDSIKGPRPGVVVVHEWNGLGDYVKRRARQLAELGYVAFAVDIYGKGVRPKTTEESAKQAAIYRNDRALMRRRANAGLGVLMKQPLVDPKRIAAIGYCFGGGVVLEMARSGDDIAGVVSFHGNLDTPNPADAKNIRAKVLVLQGAEDPVAPIEQVAALEKEMDDARVDWYMVIYGNTVHGFTNPANGTDPSHGVAYNAESDRLSWREMRDFFDRIFAVHGEKNR